MQKLCIRILLSILPALFLSACFANSGKYMTEDRYAEISLGTSVSTFKKVVGDPYEVETLDNGSKEYTYFERIQINRHMLEHREYILTVSDDRVIRKRFEELHEELKDYID